VAGSVVALVRVWAILAPFPSANPVAVPEVRAAVQVKVVPAVALDSAMPVVPPEQISCEAGVAVAAGMGLTVTTTVMSVPMHPFAEGVMVYVTVAGSGVALMSVWVMLFPFPSENPDAFPELSAAVQVNVAPAVVLESAMPVVPPEHRVCEAGVAETNGIGYTVITTVIEVPIQPFADDVMV
jgi:hypothetical protein